MKSSNTDTAIKNKQNRARLIGYILFGITVLACAAWIIYKYYAICGWKAWDMFDMGDRYRRIAYDDFPVSLIIVSLFAGALSTKKRSKIVHLMICYVYLMLLICIIPIAWQFATDGYSLSNFFEDIIVFCSYFSIIIIPCFSISSFLVLLAKKLLVKAQHRSTRI